MTSPDPFGPGGGDLAPPKPAAIQAGILEAEVAGSALEELIQANRVIELRVLGAKTASSGWGVRPQTYSGFFDDKDAAVNALTRFSAWKGAYATLNPVLPDLLARANNRFGAEDSTKDHEVTRRTQLLIDIDPVRPKGISSTDAGHEAAIRRAGEIAEWQSVELSWPKPTLVDSGNGAHLRYSIDLPREDGGLVQRVLMSVAALYSDEKLEIDTCVFNASRIARLPGTKACKGDSTAERPHRMAKVISQPDSIEVVSEEQLQVVADMSAARPEPQQQREGAAGGCTTSPHRFDVDAFVQRHGLAVRKESEWCGGHRWILDHSPLCASHGPDAAAFIVQFPSGALAAGCQHQSCTWKWQELRGHLEPERMRAGEMPGVRKRHVGRGIQPGSIVRAADRENYGTVSSISADRESAYVTFVSKDGHSATVELPLDQLTVTTGGAASRSILGEPRLYEFYDLKALLEARPPQSLVNGILDEGNVAVLYGAPASYKSFVALDLALTVAVGVPWKRGEHQTRESNVVYFSGEGQAGLGQRILAWLKSREAVLSQDGSENSELRDVVQRRFRASGEAIPLIDPTEPETVLAALEELTGDLDAQPKFIVLDTLARCFLGGDENSSKDMGRFIEGCDEIRKRTGAVVLIVHHTGKDGDLERGSSALRAGADVMIKAERDDGDSPNGGRVTLTFEKRKDGAVAEDMVVDLRLLSFRDSHGEDQSSLAAGLEASRTLECRVDGKGRARRRSDRGSPAEHQRLQILHSLATSFRSERATADKLMADAGIPKSTIYKRLASLVEDGRIEAHSDARSTSYSITSKGMQSLSPQSLPSPETKTKGVSPQSPQSPTPPLRGGGDETETETRSGDGKCDV